MVNYKEILRLSHEGYSQRQLESSLHCSRHTIREVLTAIIAAIKPDWFIRKSKYN